MREIKFRAWIYKERMVNVDMIDFTGVMPNGSGSPKLYIDGDVNPWFSDAILMQFAGLKDKNGKEIYEGDILGFSDKRKRKKENLEIIKWEDSSIEDDWGNSNPYSGFTLPTNMSDNDWEVIGNIYENKDLLQVEKCE